MQAHILVVDDDELVRSGLRLNLEREGFRISTAATSEEALEVAGRERPDLILCDIVLGAGDGMAVLREARERWPEVPLIMITGHGSIRNALEALQAGARDYIQKPANPDEVAHRIRTVLDQEHLRGALAAERRRAELRRKEQDGHLVRAERMASLGLLAEGAAAHLRGILSPLPAHRQRLSELLPGDGETGAILGAIDEIARRADEVLEDLQAIGQSGQYDKESLSLAEVLAGYQRSPEYQRLRKTHPQVRVEVHVAAHLPPVNASPSAVSQIIGNLLANACESAAPAGQVDVTLSLEQVDRPASRFGRGTPGPHVALRVRDSGSALSDEDALRFFEPFYAQRRVGRREVSGLGLTLVHRLVEDHGGHIDLTHEGGGNNFHVFLPIEAEEGQADATSAGGSELVLVVDDCEAHRNHARELLEGLGYQVATAENEQEARAICRQQERDGRPVSLVVMDLLLGGSLDGVDLVRTLREAHPELRAVLVSGFAETSRISEAKRLGLRCWIQKPLSGLVLGRAVRSELDTDL